MSGNVSLVGISVGINLSMWGAVSRGRPRLGATTVLSGLGLPLVGKPHVVTDGYQVVATSGHPAGTSRHCAVGAKNTPRINIAFVYEPLEQLVGLILTQADVAAYAGDLGIGIHPVPSTCALMHPYHRFATRLRVVAMLGEEPKTELATV
jgi:hypothetical protein